LAATARRAKCETLHSILVGPHDISGDGLAIILVTHAYGKGMSVLRDAAPNAEFEAIISQRLGGRPERWFAGVASLRSADVRALSANADTE
jgi:hypothetical protein